ncbi:MAG: putative lipoprotein [Myxococcaceae bacterium]|nr:putative lipoprotein [Myxococcaceae bacterium]
MTDPVSPWFCGAGRFRAAEAICEIVGLISSVMVRRRPSTAVRRPLRWGPVLAPRSVCSLAFVALLLPLGVAGCEIVAGISDIQLASNVGADGGDASVDVNAPDGAVCHRGGPAMSAVCDCTQHVDADRDGYFACDADPTRVDCDDADPNVHPGATETCNGKDDDCNGIVDDVPAHLHGSLFPPVDAHWVAKGSTQLGTTNGATLTQDVMNETGAVWWRTPYVFDAFDMTATFAIEAKIDGADGCAFGWVPGVAVPGVGPGNGYGLAGLGGYGVAIDTYRNTGEPPVPFLIVLGVQNNTATYAIPNVRDGRNHAMRVQLGAGKLNVWIDTIKYVNDLMIPDYAPFTGYWGFAAGGGNAFEAHYLADMTMSFPNGQGCLP